MGDVSEDEVWPDLALEPGVKLTPISASAGVTRRLEIRDEIESDVAPTEDSEGFLKFAEDAEGFQPSPKLALPEPTDVDQSSTPPEAEETPTAVAERNKLWFKPQHKPQLARNGAF